MLANRFEQVGDGLHAERLDGVVVVSGAEDQGGRIRQLAQAAGSLHPVHARHSDVQQQNVRLKVRHLFQRAVAVHGFTTGLVPR